MSAKELVVVRDPNLVHYLASETAWGVERSIAFKPGANFGLLRFIRADDNGDPILKIDGGAFTFFHSLSVEQARLLALALNVAADEAEGAVEARMACVAAGA